MQKLKSLFLAALFLTQSCTTVQLRKDPVPPAILSNYPSAEFYACGKHWSGLGLCRAEKGSDLNAKIFLHVQGYYDGVLKVEYSPASCGQSFETIYTNSQVIPVPLSDNMQDNCVVGFVIAPQYPSQKESAVAVYPLKGMLRIRMINDGEMWQGFKSFIPEGGTRAIKVQAADPKYYMYLRGCGLTVDQQLVTSTGGFVSLDSSLVTGSDPVCVLEGKLAGKSGIISFTWFIAKYANTFTPLSRPVVNLSGKVLSVKGDTAVSIIALNGNKVYDTKAQFKFNDKAINVLRLLTVNGRTVIMDWLPGIGWNIVTE